MYQPFDIIISIYNKLCYNILGDFMKFKKILLLSTLPIIGFTISSCGYVDEIHEIEKTTYDFVNWVLEYKDSVPKEKIDAFWSKMRVYHYCDFQKKLIQFN